MSRTFRALRGWLLLPHTFAVVVVVGATGAFALLAAGGDPPPGRFVLLLLGMLGGQLAVGALNEWCDREADALHQPHKPIPAGEVPAWGALAMTGAGLALMLGAGALLGWRELLVLAVANGGGLAYDLGLKRTPLSWLPYLFSLPLVPLWAWLVMDRFQPRLLWLYPLGALLIVAIHLAQVLPDISADRSRGERGLGVFLGERGALALLWAAAGVSVAAVALGAALFGRRPLAGLLVAAVVGLLLLGALLLHRRAPARVQPHLFEVLTLAAVALGCGWAVAML